MVEDVVRYGLILSRRLALHRHRENPIDPDSGSRYSMGMRIISRKTLKVFWERHPDAESALQAWYVDVKRSKWRSPADIKSIYRSASLVANNRIVFNIKGNSYRIVTAVQYQFGIVYIRFVGTHEEYGHIDAATI
jgi:mRNA interferase HigB